MRRRVSLDLLPTGARPWPIQITISNRTANVHIQPRAFREVSKTEAPDPAHAVRPGNNSDRQERTREHEGGV